MNRPDSPRLEVPCTPLQASELLLDVDGVSRSTQTVDGLPIHWSVEGVRNFWRWFGDSALQDAAGRPIVMYHGTMQSFEHFRLDKASQESNLGAGVYFTSEVDDMNTNYACLDVDMKAKVSQMADRLACEMGKSEDDPEIQRIVHEHFIEHEGLAIPSFVCVRRPVVLDPHGMQYAMARTFLDFEEVFDEELDDYTGEVNGLLSDFLDALRRIAQSDRYDEIDIERSIEELMSRAVEDQGLYADEAIELLAESEGLRYAQDMKAEVFDLCSRDIIRQAFEEIGFDGFIDYDVYHKFAMNPRERPVGMRGLYQDTFHVVAFNADQAKSALGNVGWFSPGSSDLTDASYIPESADEAEISSDEACMEEPLSGALSLDVAPA